MAVASVSILDFHAQVAAPPGLLRELQALFPPVPDWLPSGAGEPATSVLRVERCAAQPGWFEVARDDTPLWATNRAEEILPYLEWAVNSAAVERLGSRYLLLHAGAVAHAGRGLILPAAPGSGKTTLTAGLVAHGFDYFSDEVAVLDPATLRLLPFPKSLCVKPGARPTLARLYPRLADQPPRLRHGGQPVWYLPPPEGAWPAEPATVRYVVLPRYIRGGSTALTPISRTDALQRLLEQSFSLREHGAHGVGAVTAVLQGAECYALAVGTLDDAVHLLLRLVEV